MGWLEAMLAFGLAMFVFSTLVSGVLEVSQRVLGKREKGLRLMLERTFDDLAGQLHVQADDGQRTKFLERMTANPMAPKLWGIRLARTRLSSLPVEEFLARLADTELGDHISHAGRAKLDPLITDVARRYERLGASASSYFHERARSLTILLAIAFALTANIDGVRLFRTFLVERALTESFVARAMTLEAEQVVRPGGDALPPREPAADPSAQAQQIPEQIRELAAAGVPIGWGLYPWADDFGTTGHLETLDATLRAAVWFLSVLITGLLIGLGGPFWYDVVTGLTRLLGVGGGGGKQGVAPAAGAPSIATAIAPSSPRDAFEIARVSAVGAAATPRARKALGRDGMPIDA